MIKHILADGTELKSIEGRTIPSTGKTEAVYRMIAELITSSKSNMVPGHKAGMGGMQIQILTQQN